MGRRKKQSREASRERYGVVNKVSRSRGSQRIEDGWVDGN